MAFVVLVIAGIIIMGGIFGTIVAGPILLPFLAVIDILIPLIISLFVLRFFSLAPLVAALLPPDKKSSGLRFAFVFFLVLILSAIIAWGVGALSIIGLSSQPPPGLILPFAITGIWYYKLGIVWLDVQNILVFVGTGLLEIGLPIWALISLIATLIGGWKRIAIFERNRLRNESIGYEKNPNADFMIMLSGIFCFLGMVTVIFFPVIMYTSPRLYAVWHLGGWSPLIKIHGITTTIAGIGYHPYNALFVMFPWHNWSVLLSLLPKWAQTVIPAILVLAGLNLFAMLTHKKKIPVISREAAAEECARIRRTCSDRRRGIIRASLDEISYASYLEMYANGKQSSPPELAEFGLTREVLEERLAEREKADEEWRVQGEPLDEDYQKMVREVVKSQTFPI